MGKGPVGRFKSKYSSRVPGKTKKEEAKNKFRRTNFWWMPLQPPALSSTGLPEAHAH